MACNHSFIYLGLSKENKNIIKVGQTQQTCWARCKYADYRIGLAFEIFTSDGKRCIDNNLLTQIEKEILQVFREQFLTVKGREYFKISEDWEDIKWFFAEELQKILNYKHVTFEMFYKWVEPYTY